MALTEADTNRTVDARRLLEQCGLDHGGLPDAEAVTRADAIAAAAASYRAGGLPDLGAMFDEHVADEFVARDVDATMTTMTAEPYVQHVPVMTGGVGRDNVRRFYAQHFIGKWPADTTITGVSRTVGMDQVVDELILSFTHDIEMDAIIPGVAPTGSSVELPMVVVMGFSDGLVAHEHIYWDQATALVQIGLLPAAGLPVTGVEQARMLLDKSLPLNTLLVR